VLLWPPFLFKHALVQINQRLETGLLCDGCSVDAWAMGVLVYELLVGHPPFEREKRSETYDQIMFRRPQYPAWLSDLSQSFIKAALTKARLSCILILSWTSRMLQGYALCVHLLSVLQLIAIFKHCLHFIL
jgi:serine/threonine protein kinase